MGNEFQVKKTPMELSKYNDTNKNKKADKGENAASLEFINPDCDGQNYNFKMSGNVSIFSKDEVQMPYLPLLRNAQKV